ncbi:hypothetical protein Thimo_0837 [Thioflavicoccus mobilis 8321]|uniref:Uncharacterized protein n=1 Tax=Thioflavicoccus mobilis 8321 TaxID=765912 RepID=L0GSE2_9GAMM|nr:hypothetical protein Thimo_0837 [Thioflavicoccus mobilis 8321]
MRLAVSPSVDRKLDADRLAILAKDQTESQSAVLRFLHFQPFKRLKMAGLPAPHGKRD